MKECLREDVGSLHAAMDMEQELQKVEEQDEDNSMHHDGRYARPLVRELDGAVISGDLQQQPWREQDEEDDTNDQGRGVHHLGCLFLGSRRTLMLWEVLIATWCGMAK